MGGRIVARAAVVLAAGALSALAAASCVASYSHCDYTVRRCRTVCDYSCDFFGCHPSCVEQCWQECYYVPPPMTPSLPPSPPVPPAHSVLPDGAPTDGGGALCAACASNDECKTGALCIVPGGDSASSSAFCTQPCETSGDCPDAFSCTLIGSGKHCLPVFDACH